MKKRTDSGAGVLTLALLVVLVAVLGWRITSFGIGNTFSQLALSGQASEDVLHSALSWSPRNPATLYKASANISSGTDFSQKKHLLESALDANPGDGRVMANLALEHFITGNYEQGDALVHHAVRLLPSDVDTLVLAGEYWWQRDDKNTAVGLWSRALAQAPDLKTKLFPIFLNLLERSTHPQVMRSVIQQVPVWWLSFLQYAADNATLARTMKMLYQFRLSANTSLTADDYRIYLDYLENEQKWGEAFIVWANSLGQENLGKLGQPTNGGFEYDISDYGFDWHITHEPGVLIKTDYTFGISGQRALRIAFRGEPVDFAHVSQRLLLHPQRYRLSGRVRPDSLRSQGGLQWSVSCTGLGNKKERILARSERFQGIDQWRQFSFRFRIPENCPGQMVRLEAANNGESEQTSSGEIWFDDLKIERI